MGQLIQNVQDQMRQSTQSFGLFVLRLISGLFVGLVLTIAGEVAVGYETLGFFFVLIVFLGAFLRISRGWSFGGLMIFNLVCVLIGLLLRMYVLIAPGN